MKWTKHNTASKATTTTLANKWNKINPNDRRRISCSQIVLWPYAIFILFTYTACVPLFLLLLLLVWPSKRFQSTRSIQLEDGMLLSLLLLSVSPLCVGSAYACLGCIANEDTDRLERKQQNIHWHSFFSHVITQSTLFGLLGLYFPSDLAQWLRLCLFACGVMMGQSLFVSQKVWNVECIDAPPPSFRIDANTSAVFLAVTVDLRWTDISSLLFAFLHRFFCKQWMQQPPITQSAHTLSIIMEASKRTENHLLFITAFPSYILILTYFFIVPGNGIVKQTKQPTI